MITLKHKYLADSNKTISDYCHQYFICFKIIYNFMKEGLTQREIKNRLLKYENIELIKTNSWFLASLFYEVKALIDSQDNWLNKIQKRLKDKNFKNYKKKQKAKKSKRYLQGKLCFNKVKHTKLIKHLISKDEFKKINNPLRSIGDALKHSNRFFRIVDEETILFQPNRNTKIELKLYGHKNHRGILGKLKEWQENNLYPISYKLDNEYIYISYEEKYLQVKKFKPKENRVFAIDLNPNYIGYSIIDWKDTENGKFNVVEKGVISQKSLNDYQQNLSVAPIDKLQTYITNKRNFETFEISKQLVTLAKHFKCNLFAIEELCIDSEDIGRGRKTNRLCNNQWNRVKLVNNLRKRCNLIGIKFHEVPPEYTSFIGNTVFRYLNLPDMILASVEISRRCYEFYLQYKKKTKQPSKIIRFPKLNDFVKNSIEQAIEAFSIPVVFENYLKFYWFIKKNLGNKYRVPLDESRVFRQRHMKYQVILFNGV